MVEYTVWEKIKKIFWYEIKTWGACRNTRVCILEVNPEGLGPEELGGDQQYVCLPFCWSWIGVWDILKKKIRGNRKKEYWFWHRLLGHHCTLVLGLKKISCGACLYYLMLFWWQKRIAFKITWTCTFIPWLLNSWFTLETLVVFRDVEEGEFSKLFCLSGKWFTSGQGLPGVDCGWEETMGALSCCP